MDLRFFKDIGVSLLIGVNLILLVWAITAYRQKRSLSDNFYALLPVSPLIAAIQWLLGFSLMGQGAHPAGMHIFYGVMVGLGAVAQVLLRRRSTLAQKYRGKPLVYAFISLFVALLSARSWMTH